MNDLQLYFYLSALGASFVLSLIMTPLVRKLAIAYGKVAVPKDDRWHKKTTALLGGISIFYRHVDRMVPGRWIHGLGHLWAPLFAHDAVRFRHFRPGSSG